MTGKISILLAIILGLVLPSICHSNDRCEDCAGEYAHMREQVKSKECLQEIEYSVGAASSIFRELADVMTRAYITVRSQQTACRFFPELTNIGAWLLMNDHLVKEIATALDKRSCTMFDYHPAENVWDSRIGENLRDDAIHAFTAFRSTESVYLVKDYPEMEGAGKDINNADGYFVHLRNISLPQREISLVTVSAMCAPNDARKYPAVFRVSFAHEQGKSVALSRSELAALIEKRYPTAFIVKIVKLVENPPAK